MITRIWFIKEKGEVHQLLITPYKASIEQLALFTHCAAGLCSVTPTYFDEVVAPLLKQHGIEEWDFLKEGDTIPEQIMKDKCGEVSHNFTAPVKDGLGMRSVCTKCGATRYY